MKYTAAVITISDKGSRGERVDTSGPAVCRMLEEAGFDVVYTNIIPDEMEQIKAELTACADEKKIGLVMTTGGTGFSQRDITPEATLAVVERETRGIPEAMRWAIPSTMADFPTPGSPMSMGLFFFLRPRISMTREISLSRPTTGSSLPSRAARVRS